MTLQPVSPATFSTESKIVGLDFLAQKTTWRRRAGLKVVHAHGCFDLLHPGHVAHLKSARDMGDMLVVTVTTSGMVNKGPGRPVYSDAQRAEMLAALEYVDYVAINYDWDAVGAIHKIQPSVYVKGRDYEQKMDWQFVAERATVELYGGKVVCTDDELMSSSELINRHVNVYEPQVRQYLDSLRPHLNQIIELIHSVAEYRVLVVGDAIIDEYQYVLPIGKPPKESVIATKFQDVELFAGGVFATANHVASFVKDVDVVTCLGDSVASYDDFILSKLRKNVRLLPLTRPRSPTTTKTRWVDRASMRKLFEVYRIDDSPLPDTLQRGLAEMMLGQSAYDVVIIADFGHGLIHHPTMELLGRAPFLAVNTQTNSGNYGYNPITKYTHADYVCIDEPEARLAAADRTSPLGVIAERLAGQMVCDKWLITSGKNGSLNYQTGLGDRTSPALAKSVVDTVGAGDAVFAVTAPMVRAGGPMDWIGFIGNVVGALAVGIVGNRSSVEKTDVVRSITGLLK